MSSWLKSYRHGSYFAKRIRDKQFFAYHHKVLERILARPTTTVTVACKPGEENTIFGYLITEFFAAENKTIIHFVYVKDAFRGFGVAKQLLETVKLNPNVCYFSHWTFAVDELIKKYPGMTYNPYLI